MNKQFAYIGLGIQNGLIGLGAFYALTKDVNGWIVFLFCFLLWGYRDIYLK